MTCDVGYVCMQGTHRCFGGGGGGSRTWTILLWLMVTLAQLALLQLGARWWVGGGWGRQSFTANASKAHFCAWMMFLDMNTMVCFTRCSLSSVD